MGIEPTSEAWEASILPLYDARSFFQRSDYTQRRDCSYRPAIFHIFQFPAGKRCPYLLEGDFSLISCRHPSGVLLRELARFQAIRKMFGLRHNLSSSAAHLQRQFPRSLF